MTETIHTLRPDKNVLKGMLAGLFLTVSTGCAKPFILDGPGMVKEWNQSLPDYTWVKQDSDSSDQLIFEDDTVKIMEDGKEIGIWNVRYVIETGEILPMDDGEIGPYSRLLFRRESIPQTDGYLDAIEAYPCGSSQPVIYEGKWGE